MASACMRAATALSLGMLGACASCPPRPAGDALFEQIARHEATIARDAAALETTEACENQRTLVDHMCGEARTLCEKTTEVTDTDAHMRCEAAQRRCEQGQRQVARDCPDDA